MFPLAGRHYSISGCCLANSVENFWGYLFRHFTCCICEVDSPIFTRVICGGHAPARTQARSAPSCSRLGQVVRTIPTVPNGPHRRPNTRAPTQALVKRLISVPLNHPDYPMLPPSEKAKLRKILIPLSSSDHILVRGSLLRPFADSKNVQVEAHKAVCAAFLARHHPATGAFDVKYLGKGLRPRDDKIPHGRQTSGILGS